MPTFLYLILTLFKPDHFDLIIPGKMSVKVEITHKTPLTFKDNM